MNSREPSSGNVSQSFAWTVMACIVILFAVRNVPWNLGGFDQAKQAYVSYEIVGEGQWLHQHTPRGNFATKPPLAGWISALVFRLTGSTSWDIAWRGPVFLCAMVLLFSLYREGSRLYGGRVGGLLAAGAFGFTTFTPRLATLVRTDMMLALLIYLTGLLVLRKSSGEPWTPRDRWQIFLLVLATQMTKGPIGYGFLLPGLVAFWFLTRRLGLANRTWSGALSWFAPLVFFGAWIGLGVIQHEGFYEQVVLREFMGRFTVGERAVHHNFPPGFYTLHLLGWMVISSVLMIGLVCVREVRAAFRTDRQLLWLATWAIGGLVFMESVPSKRFDRIFPAVAPLCLMLPAMARHLPARRLFGQPFGKIATLASVGGMAIAGGYAGWCIFQAYDTKRGDLVEFGSRVRDLTNGRVERLAIVSGPDEAMLMYAGGRKFTRMDDALRGWHAGRVDWLLLARGDFDRVSAMLGRHEILIEVGKASAKQSGYVLVRRPGGADRVTEEGGGRAR